MIDLLISISYLFVFICIYFYLFITKQSRAEAKNPKEEARIRDMVLYKDEHFIAINKPTGLACQGKRGTQYSSVVRRGETKKRKEIGSERKKRQVSCYRWCYLWLFRWQWSERTC